MYNYYEMCKNSKQPEKLLFVPFTALQLFHQFYPLGKTVFMA